MSSLFSVTTQAEDISLLTIAEMRAAIGLATTDTSKDAILQPLAMRAADRITRACNVAVDGAIMPTLREEAVSDTFRARGFFDWGSDLTLSRRPITAIIGVTEDDIAVDSADYEILAATGMLRRLCNDDAVCWRGCKIVVSYTAGWATVPSGLKLAAEQLLRSYWYDASRDPGLRQIEVPGVISKQFWVGSSADPDIPDNVLDMLEPFMNPALG